MGVAVDCGSGGSVDTGAVVAVDIIEVLFVSWVGVLVMAMSVVGIVLELQLARNRTIANPVEYGFI